MNTTQKNYQNKFHEAVYAFISVSIAFLPILILIRFYEMTFISKFYHFPVGSWKFELLGLGYDFLIFLKLTSILAIPFLIFYSINRVIGKIFYILMSILIVCSSIGLAYYFGASGNLLGADLFKYSKAEIDQTVSASGELNIFTFLPFLLFIAITIFIEWKMWIINMNRYLSRVIYIILAAILIFLNFDLMVPQENNFKIPLNASITANKLSYFMNSSYDYFFPKTNIKDPFDIDLATTPQGTANDQNANAKTSNISKSGSVEAGKTNNNTSSSKTNTVSSAFEYVSNEYPFLHKDKTVDVLGRFFNKGDKAPNIVFILVESLGRSYTGEDAALGSFTPFLDSLMKKSLYWENFLSTAGKTFCVLPSIMASVPYGESGFAEMGENMPNHQSLLRLLKNRGYTGSFYYGGEAHFDNMDIFLRHQMIDKIIDSKNFGNGYTRLPAGLSSGFSWGYGDKEIFRRYLNEIKNAPKVPRVDIMLTLAMHSPFRVTDQDYYDKKFEARLKTLKIPDKDKDYDRQYKAQFATMLYFDDALRYLITEYSKRDDFKNTIFIITGDHRMPEIPLATQIDRFHVPLVIYSPMLKAGQKFSSISTHLDITPSLLAFLRDNYSMRFPSLCAWIGSGLDVEPGFRNIHSYPLMRNKNQFVDYIDKLDFLSNGTLYKIYKTLDIEPENIEIDPGIKAKFEDFKTKNAYACKNNKIIPDSLLKK